MFTLSKYRFVWSQRCALAFEKTRSAAAEDGINHQNIKIKHVGPCWKLVFVFLQPCLERLVPALLCGVQVCDWMGGACHNPPTKKIIKQKSKHKTPRTLRVIPALKS